MSTDLLAHIHALEQALDGRRESALGDDVHSLLRVIGSEAERLARREKELMTLYEVGREIASILDLSLLLESIIDKALALAEAERGFIVLSEGEEPAYEIKVARRFGAEEMDPSQMEISRSIVEQVLTTRQPLLTTNAQQDPRFLSSLSVAAYQIRSVMGVPLIVKEELIGAIYVDTRVSVRLFEESDLNLLHAMANQAAVAIRMARLYQDLENLFLGTVEALVSALEAKDPYTRGHSRRVTQVAVAIGEEMKLSPQERNNLRLAGLLHDIGKIGSPEAILNKAGSLVRDERTEMERHPVHSGQIVGHVPQMADIVPAIRNHHERYDGQGYPDRLTGAEIPFLARILAVADTFDAMTSDRPYRKAQPVEEAIRVLKEVAGSQHDPQVSVAFLRAFEKGKIPLSAVETTKAPSQPGTRRRLD